LPPLAAAQQAWQEHVKSCSDEPLQWFTRRSIHFQNLVRYPDLMLCSGENRPLLIVENKIGSGIGEHEVSQPNNTPGSQLAETIDQLATYGRWLSVQCQQHPWLGALAFLTHFTAPPAGFNVGDRSSYGVEWQSVCRWRDVWKWLDRSHPSSGGSIMAWQDLAADLAEFLKEQKMNLESVTFYDISAAEIFIKSAAQFEYTFKQARDSLRRQWPGMAWSKMTRGCIQYNSEGGVLRDWMNLNPPYSPVNCNNWFIAWGFRFPELSGWWKDASPALPQTNYAFVSVGSEGQPQLPVSAQQVRDQLAGSWSVVPNDCIVTGRALCEFSGEAETLGDLVIKWIATKAEELKPVLPQLVQLGGQQPRSETSARACSNVIDQMVSDRSEY